ncbi:MAG: hypothetical protein IKK22_05345 [Firmicutes bacterium]|nr:hypothetical protein [Bacillota bacterium]MBR4074825.1 hypothetical protein [Bacillota bacterium]
MDNTFVAVLLAGILANNYAIQNFLGMDTVLGNYTTANKSCKLGLLVTAVMVISTVICWPLSSVLKSMAYLQTLVFVVVVLIVTEIVQIAAQSMIKKTMGEGFVMLAVNGAVLGLMIQNAELTFGEAVISSLGVGLGFMAAMTVFASLRERVEDEFVPAAFRGLPVSLLIAAMMSLVLFAF